MTSDTTKLSECFSTSQPFEMQAKKWDKELCNIFHLAFKKGRVRDNKVKDNKIMNLLENRKSIKIDMANTDVSTLEDLQKQLEEVDGTLAKECENENLAKVFGYIFSLVPLFGILKNVKTQF